MYTKQITYTDYDGNERTENFYFNLTKAELIEMDMSVAGGLQKMVEKIVESQDAKQIMEVVKDIILRSYGEKSADGRRFVKSKEMATNFEQTEAYSELFMQIATDEKEATAFINGIVPRDLAAQLNSSTALPVQK